MTHLWNQSIDINEKKARSLIESQHAITIKSIYALDEGWDNIAYLVNDTLIFRFPRRELGVVCIENEIALLPYIATQVSFSLSAPQWIGEPSDLYPYPFAGYPMIPGDPVSDIAQSFIADTQFAVILARWLAELHATPVTEHYASLIKGNQSWRYDVPHRVSRCKENLTNYEKYFLELGFDKKTLLGTIASLPHLTFKEDKKSYLHGDLYSRHVMVNSSAFTPSGLIDWGDTHIGHPGIDLEIGMIFTEEAFQTFLHAYGDIDDSTFNLLLFHTFCRHMSFLPYACEKNRPHLKQWASMVLTKVIHEINKRQ
ncbi:phosphotransferase [bacterium]|nr:phosphotransferase [bacterium]MDA9271888.1 phosphotransferase [bacterium]